MKEYTQKHLFPKGSCWQTAVACVLEVDPDCLPSQFDSYYEDKREDGSVVLRMSYNNPLQAYLRKHHGLAYIEFHQPHEAFEQISIHGYHILTGETVRSPEYNGQRHVVVGKDGKMVWDPHPSRAGLTNNINIAVLCPFPASWEKTWANADDKCICPLCRC